MQVYERLEERFATFCGNPNTVACSSGTAALHLAIETLKVTEGWEEGTKVVVPDFTMIACARAVTMAGLTLEFADVNDLGLLEYDKVSTNVGIVMAVHLYGRRCFLNYQHVIEDLAEAHSIPPDPDSLAACWSFYRNKIICGEEGGMIAFKNEEQATLARKLRNLGNDGHFNHLPNGHNYRLSNCHAELILQSLASYNKNLAARQHIETIYDIYVPREWQLPSRETPWVYDLELPVGVDVDWVVTELNQRGIEARCGFKPLSTQEEYHTPSSNPNLPCNNPIALRLSQTRMYLPIVPGMTREPVRRIVARLRKVVEQATNNTPA